jgi:hypothetical protein
MTRNSPITPAAVLGALGLAASLACGLASADPRDDHRRDEHFRPAPSAHEHVDARFSHNHPYYNRGFVVRDLPRDRIIINRGPNRFFYSAGVWYAPRGPSFVVVAPPIGVFVPLLPPYYSTVWFGGVPYYYANDTYYMWNAQNSGYEVVDPPSGAVNAAPDEQSPQPPTTTQLFIYPRNNQSTDQQAKDKYECHASASGQTGFDPTASGGNVSPDQFNAKSTDYYRAMAACLQARGYSVE